MWQLSESIDGMAEACRALGIPVIGGNVSLYNESRGRDIDPTPVIGTLGLVNQLSDRPAGVQVVEGSALVLIGALATSLAGSRWAVDLHRHRGGQLPDLDLELHRRLLTLVSELVNRSPALIDGVHDVSDGGLGVALGEMAVRSQVGFRVEGIPDHRALFGEGPSRVILSVPPAALSDVQARCQAAGLAWVPLGTAGGDRLVVAGLVDVTVADAVAWWRGALPRALAGGEGAGGEGAGGEGGALVP
jgi:phosphoribosylformylglycinamidine synthase subunit PurL